MSVLNARKPSPAPDRRLGDEWADWDGSAAAESRAPAWVFLALAGGALILLVLLFWSAVWMIWPRLLLLGLARPGLILAAAVSAYAGIWYACVCLAATGAAGLRQAVRRLGGIRWMISPAVTLGKIFGISRDRVGHAFMLVHNRLEVLPPLIRESERLLVILPRCLGRAAYQGLEALKARYGFTQVVVAGGSEARRAIGQVRPEGLIAVACERDLLSGVKDVKGRVPVLAFSNQRPEGPCKQTEVDLKKIEEALQMFLGTPKRLQPLPNPKNQGGVQA